jgi:hypothetical protein
MRIDSEGTGLAHGKALPSWRCVVRKLTVEGCRQRRSSGEGVRATDLVLVISSWALTVGGSSGCWNPAFPQEPSSARVPSLLQAIPFLPRIHQLWVTLQVLHNVSANFPHSDKANVASALQEPVKAGVLRSLCSQHNSQVCRGDEWSFKSILAS